MNSTWKTAASLFALVAAGCSTAAPAATTGPLAPTIAAPATATVAAITPAAPTVGPPTVAAATSPPVVTVPPVPTLAPAGTTARFHLVIDDGPRAGTYDVSSVGPADCGYLPNLDRWTAVYLGPAPLTFIQASLDDDLPSLLVSFDSDLPTFTSILPKGDVTYAIDDRGQTATLSVVSEENEADFTDSPSVDFGRMELTVECLSVFRY